MTSPNFLEIERLPGWIKEGVKDNFGHNPMIKINDVIALVFSVEVQILMKIKPIPFGIL